MTEPLRASPRPSSVAGREHAVGPVEVDALPPPRRELVEPDLPRTAKVRTGTLRTGWTTGTCATAAAKAAVAMLVTGQVQRTVEIGLPSGRRVTFPVERCELVHPGTPEAVVVKDAGDDPDVTHGAHLTATVAWADASGVHLWGGDGVGTVTKPGLGLEVGGPAINGTPRHMIRAAVAEVADPEVRGLDVVISVPGGEQMAKKTTNARLGIVGGISILGTTGIVRPFSTASWRASVLQAVDVMAAQGEDVCVLSTGGRTEKAAMRLLPNQDHVVFVEVGDFTGAAVTRCVERGIRRVVFVGMAGKLAKLGAGVLMTHYTRSKVDTGYLAEVTARGGGDDALVAAVGAANTGRHAFELWDAAGIVPAAADVLCTDVVANLTAWARQHGAGDFSAHAVLVDFDTLDPVGANPGALAHLASLREASAAAVEGGGG
jgi:cobalt-precorrin-5B (C1)-methyltransferase